MSCKNQLMSFFIAVLTVCFLTGCADLSHNQGGGYQVTDVEGTVITIAHKPQRILTVSAGTDELMLGLVEPERMAAVNGLLDDPVSSIRIFRGCVTGFRRSSPAARRSSKLRRCIRILSL